MYPWLVGAAMLALIGTVVFGYATGRLDRRADGCCPADPARDLRMRAAFAPVELPDSAADTATAAGDPS